MSIRTSLDGELISFYQSKISPFHCYGLLIGAVLKKRRGRRFDISIDQVPVVDVRQTARTNWGRTYSGVGSIGSIPSMKSVYIPPPAFTKSWSMVATKNSTAKYLHNKVGFLNAFLNIYFD